MTMPNIRKLLNKPNPTLSTPELNDLFRYCADIGMYATDRPINDTANHKGSCVHRTSFCDVTCYNMKLYRMYKNMTQRDDRCETVWQKINSSNVVTIAQWLFRRRKSTKRGRHMTRGESIKNIADVYRIKDICLATPDTLWWVPTRAWRNPLLKALIQIELLPLTNCQINASFDPSNTDEEWKLMQDSGWNIMFYGDDSRTVAPNGERMFLCPKTHKKLSGHCIDCKAGCFSQKTINRTTVVHLSAH